MKKLLSVVVLATCISGLQAGDGAGADPYLTPQQAVREEVVPDAPMRPDRIDVRARRGLFGPPAEVKAAVASIKTTCNAVVNMARPFFTAHGCNIETDSINTAYPVMGIMQNPFLLGLQAAYIATCTTAAAHPVWWEELTLDSMDIMLVLKWAAERQGQ